MSNEPQSQGDSTSGDSTYSAFAENMRLMNGIVREMKEIPELPSETPKDINSLIKVEFPVEGGVLTYMENQEFPYKGFPYYEFVDRIDLIKKISRAFLSSIYHQLKNKNKFWFVTLLPGLWVAKCLVRSGIYVFFRVVERFKVKPLRYCTALRELHRALSVEWGGENDKKKEMRIQLRDLVCMVLEFDNAYRFRLQDLLEELNKQELKNNPIKELIRLLSIISEREVNQEVKDTWKLLQLFSKYYLRFDKDLLKIIQDTLLLLDIDKVKLSIEDKSYCRPRKDYVFGFIKKELCQQQNST